MEYELELDEVAKRISQKKARRVLIQLPDGLKPSAKAIQQELEAKTGATILIWGGSCFGACDLPLGLENLKVDLAVQFGHSEWK